MERRERREQKTDRTERMKETKNTKILARTGRTEKYKEKIQRTGMLHTPATTQFDAEGQPVADNKLAAFLLIL